MQFNNIKCYNTFLIDLFGVIHDGISLYPGVLEVLKDLKKNDKEIVFLSNAPRRANDTKKVLESFGIDKSFYKEVITSGELAYNIFFEQDLLKGDYFYIGPIRDYNVLEGLKYKAIKEIDKASCLVVTGFFDDHSNIEDIIIYLDKGLERNLTLFCLNPDIHIVRQNGKKELCAGAIASYYANKGGQIVYFGKPYHAIYEFAFKQANITNKSAVIAIGDGLETDIRGANKFGIDSLFVANGIFKDKLFKSSQQDFDKRQLKNLCDTYKVTPTFTTSLLQNKNWIRTISD